MKYLHMESKKQEHEIYKPDLWADSNEHHYQKCMDPITLPVF